MSLDCWGSSHDEAIKNITWVDEIWQKDAEWKDSAGEMVRVVDEEPGMQPKVAMPSLESETFE